MSGRAVCCFIPDQTYPDLRCSNLAEYEIWAGEGMDPDPYTHACADHLEKLLSDAPSHAIQRIYHMPAGVLWDDAEIFTTHGLVGDWHFFNEDHDLWLKIPSLDGNPRGEVIHLYIHREGQEPANKPSWIWDGNREKPTLSPSIKTWNKDQEIWHGYLRAGLLEKA